MITKLSLKIIWTSHSVSGVRQVEVPGIIFYGYWASGVLPQSDAQEFSKCWPSGRFKYLVRRWPENNVLSVETRLVKWPAPTAWLSAIERCLQWFVDGGAIVSWCGDEMSSPSVSILNPDEANGMTYAAYSPATGLICNAGLMDDYMYLSDEQLERLWSGIKRSTHNL